MSKREIKFKLVFERHGHISGVDAPDYVFIVKTLDQIAESSYVGYFDNESYYTLKEVLQYTGLTDKNGVEIYESDKLQSPNTTEWIVRRNNEHACFEAHSHNVVMSPIDNLNCVVIGNIHENPELI